MRAGLPLDAPTDPKKRGQDTILAEYPYLEREDVRQALSYAAWLARDEVVNA
jgi:uncharacterized protein (DUF433 family)